MAAGESLHVLISDDHTHTKPHDIELISSLTHSQ